MTAAKPRGPELHGTGAAEFYPSINTLRSEEDEDDGLTYRDWCKKGTVRY